MSIEEVKPPKLWPDVKPFNGIINGQNIKLTEVAKKHDAVPAPTAPLAPPAARCAATESEFLNRHISFTVLDQKSLRNKIQDTALFDALHACYASREIQNTKCGLSPEHVCDPTFSMPAWLSKSTVFIQEGDEGRDRVHCAILLEEEPDDVFLLNVERPHEKHDAVVTAFDEIPRKAWKESNYRRMDEHNPWGAYVSTALRNALSNTEDGSKFAPLRGNTLLVEGAAESTPALL